MITAVSLVKTLTSNFIIFALFYYLVVIQHVQVESNVYLKLPTFEGYNVHAQ